MKSFKKYIYPLIAALALTSCGGSSSEPAKDEAKSTSELIENVSQYQKENEVAVEEIDNSDVKIETAKRGEFTVVEYEDEEDTEEEEEAEDVAGNLDEENADTVTIKAVGDIMAHKIQIQYAYNRGGGGYDFTDSFSYVKDFISDADIAIGNYETTTNPNVEYAGFPRFNAPPEYIEAIADAGFDILTTANNHSLDTELEGVFSTMEYIEKAGLSYVGSQAEGEDNILYKTVNGIKLAFLSYTYGANGQVDLLQVRPEIPELNYLNPEQIEDDIKRAKSNGADFVVVYPHWGIEYQSYPAESQIELGRDMIKWGADLVIGNHPHVVQPFEYVEASDGREGFIAYALGNFISFQNLENNGDIRVEQAVAYEISLKKDKESGAKEISEVKSHPVWVGVKYNDYGQSVQTHLAEDFLEGGQYYGDLNENQTYRASQAYDMTTETINQEVN